MKLNLRHEKLEIHEVFGVSDERARELGRHADEVFEKYSAKVAAGEEVLLSHFISEILEPCETIEEAVMMAYVVGEVVGEMRASKAGPLILAAILTRSSGGD